MESIVIEHDLSLENLFNKLEEAPEFSFYKTNYQNLAIALHSPASTLKYLRNKLCCGEMSYSLVVYSIIEEWVARVRHEATLNALLFALIQSKWDPIADYLSNQHYRDELLNKKDLSSLDYSKLISCGSIRYDPSYILGYGSFGTVVYRGLWNQRNVAVKKIFCETGMEEKVISEINILLDYDSHDNVVKYYHLEKTSSDVPIIFVAMELCNVTLKHWLDDKSRFSVKLTSIDILKQTTKGISFLHENGIIHRDIKPENILLLQMSKQKVRVKICDFGISQRLPLNKTSVTLKTNSGTAGWMAPELLERLTSSSGNTVKYKMSTATDIFSLGCVFYYVFTCGQHPFGNDQISIQNNVLHYKLQITLNNQSTKYIEVLSLILMMISKKPKRRPPAFALLKHHIFWSKKTTLQFLVAVSNATDRPLPGSQVAKCIDNVDENETLKHYCMPEQSIGWIRFLCPAVRKYVSGNHCRRKPYFGGLISELLRAMRNMQNHYVTMPAEVQDAVGPLKEPFLYYFMKRFPLLLDTVWITFEALKHDKSLSLDDFYCHDYNFSSKNISIAEMQLLDTFVRRHCAKAILFM